MAPGSGPDPTAQDLLQLATERFGDLRQAEAKLVLAAPKGEFANCGPSGDFNDPSNDPAKADAWGPERQVRAGLIRWLCTEREAADRVDPKGIRLRSAKITGRLDLAFATVTFPLGLVQCRVTDQITLQHANLPALSLDGSWTRAIAADGLNVKGDIFLREGFTAEGEVRLVGAQIGGDLTCIGGTFKNPPQKDVDGSGRALSAHGVAVRGNIFLHKGFTAEGEVGLVGAQIGGDLSCLGGTFSVLNAQAARISRHLFLRELQDPKSGTFDLTNASTDALLDDEPSWPTAGNLHLDGFVYGRISAGPTDAETRLKWLALQPEFKPQPYRQLAKVLRESGDERGARLVLYEMEKLRRTEQSRIWRNRLHNEKLSRSSLVMGWPRYGLARAWGSVLRYTIGYGFRLQCTLYWLIGLTVLGTLLFGSGYMGGSMAPTERAAYASFEEQGWPPRHYQAFNPLIYALENSVPVLKLGQDSAWAPDPGPREQERAGAVNFPPWRWLARVHPHAWVTPWLLRCYRWLQIVSGWMLATLFVAGVTGVVRRE